MIMNVINKIITIIKIMTEFINDNWILSPHYIILNCIVIITSIIILYDIPIILSFFLLLLYTCSFAILTILTYYNYKSYCHLYKYLILSKKYNYGELQYNFSKYCWRQQLYLASKKAGFEKEYLIHFNYYKYCNSISILKTQFLHVILFIFIYAIFIFNLMLSFITFFITTFLQ